AVARASPTNSTVAATSRTRPPIVSSRAIASQRVTRPASVNRPCSRPFGSVSSVGRPSSTIGALGRGPAVKLRLGDEGVPLNLPEVKALGVQLERFSTPGHADTFDQHFILGDDPLAGVTGFPVARAAPDARNAVQRKRAVLQLLADEELEAMLLHDHPLGVDGGARRRSYSLL